MALLYSYDEVTGVVTYEYDLQDLASYSDINSYAYDSFYLAKYLNVFTKDNKKFRIAGFKNLKEFESIIKKYS